MVSEDFKYTFMEFGSSNDYSFSLYGRSPFVFYLENSKNKYRVGIT